MTQGDASCSSSSSPSDFLQTVRDILREDVLQTSLWRDEITVVVPRGRIAAILEILRDDPRSRMTQLMDLCGVDYPERPERFDVVYHLLSLPLNRRLRVVVQTDSQTPVPSVAQVYSAAGWFEREAWDMFGLLFAGHADLRRLLTDYGFEGHPLRKDFPLWGFVETRYDNLRARVVYDPVVLEDPCRVFDFKSPWHAMDAPLFAKNNLAETTEEGA